MANDILDRIHRELGFDLASLLADRLGPQDLQSLMIEVYRRRAGQRSAAAILADWERDRFARPSAVEPSAFLDFDRRAADLLPPDFRLLELSPLTPLGTCSSIATASQNKTVSTARGSELVSDSTNVLALECALRRRAILRDDARSRRRVKLAASHRLVRAQRYADPRLLAHFRLFGLCTGGRDEGARRFECESLREHLDIHLRLLADRLPETAPRRVALCVFGAGPPTDAFESGVLAPLREQHHGVEFALDPDREDGRGYYDGARFAIYVTAPDGREMPLADGGPVGWTRDLLSNRKERLVISGIGTEAVCTLFADRAPAAESSA